MQKLALHVENTRQQYPDKKLMVVFDIDGTILDMRHMMLNILHHYDRTHGTTFFHQLSVADITVHENELELLLEQLEIEHELRSEILGWYKSQLWTTEAIVEAHRPFWGVLEVIRWFQIQPNMYVGLNTGRPESIREATLASLNKLGRTYFVQFTNDLLYMNPNDWEEDVEGSKIDGIKYFQDQGYVVLAVVDNEPANLEAIATLGDDAKNILLLHADTIFESKRNRLPAISVAGSQYDITDLITEKMLPRKIQFVWHGINDRANLDQFLGSEITWGECELYLDPVTERLVLNDDPPPTTTEMPPQTHEPDAVLQRIIQSGKNIKINLSQGGLVIDKLLDCLEHHQVEDDRLWFDGKVHRLTEAGLRKLHAAHPGAILQCPVDFLEPLICSMPGKAKEVLDEFRSWGINRFSVSWNNSERQTFFDQMDKWGFEVNIYDVPDLETFLQAVLYLPQSITCDFNFPKWQYYGRGLKQSGNHSLGSGV